MRIAAGDGPYVEPHEGLWPEIHHTAFVHPRAVIIGRVRIGPHASIWPHATLRGDEGEIVIGEGTNVQDGCTVHMTGGQSNTYVGSRVTVGHNVILHGCIVADRCLIGMGSTLLDNCEIGEGSYVGAGTLVTGDKIIPPNSMVFGNPFRIVRETRPKETEWIDYAWRNYRDNAAKYVAQYAALKSNASSDE